MSELTIEQKAKLYDEAIEKAEKWRNAPNINKIPTFGNRIIEDIFPELQKPNNEKIKEALIALVKCNERCGYTSLNNISTSSMINWLEKQGEQINIANKEYWRGYREGKQETLDKYAELEKQSKEIQPRSYLAPKSASQAIKEIITDNANKVKPKFKVGDWVVFNGLTLYINEVLKGYYRTISKGGTPNSYDWNIDNAARLWTIQDAKDGDVLANDHNILILKESVYDWYTNGTPYSVKAYCGIKPNGNFEIGIDNWSFCGTLHIHPATKEQRELLFTKIKEAGYEWNFDKKELINIL